jgi:hypothetical protein
MYTVSDGWMTSEKDREGSDQGLIEVLSQDLLDSLRKTTKNHVYFGSCSAKISTEHLQNTSLGHYLMTIWLHST